MKKITYETVQNTVDIIIEKSSIENIFDYLPKNKRFFLVTNSEIFKHYENFIKRFENVIIIKDGEKYKNIKTFEYIINSLLSKKIERKDCIISLGGGVTGDLSGFAAASVLRGVDLIHIPTTLLAMVDSSIGGKTGFNTKFGKNLIGAFYQPKSILVFEEFLKTLPKRQIKTGLGEVIKYAFIEKSCSNNPQYYLFDYLNDDNRDFSEIIYKSIGLKKDVVSDDEKEKGKREVLNFGHTFCHGIETVGNYKKFTHGEAVSLGIKMAFKLSYNLGIIKKDYYDLSLSFMKKFNLIDSDSIKFNKDDILNVMKSDKKVRNGAIRLVLPINRGEVKVFDNIKEEEIRKVI